MLASLSNQAAAWVWRRVVLASPYCWLWEDCFIGKGKGKRNILFPSLVITGKDFWNARQWEKRRKDIRALQTREPPIKWPRLRVAWIEVRLNIPVIAVL